jgi:hypothetical protein
LLEGKIAARQIVPAKLIKILARAWQGHDIRARRHGRATGEE